MKTRSIKCSTKTRGEGSSNLKSSPENVGHNSSDQCGWMTLIKTELEEVEVDTEDLNSTDPLSITSWQECGNEDVDNEVHEEEEVEPQVLSIQVLRQLPTEQEETAQRVSNNKKPVSWLECTLCEITLEDRVELRDHHRLSHGYTFFCKVPSCSGMFMSDNALIKHLQNYHGQIFSYIQCSQCPYWTYKESLFPKHHSSHTAKKFPCPKCPKVFFTKLECSTHTEKVHDNSSKCYYCDIKLATQDLKDHTSNTSCKNCNSNFRCQTWYQKHQKGCIPVVKPSAESLKPKKFGCSKCAMEFKTEEARKAHERVHVNNSQCYYCSEKMTLDALKHHTSNTLCQFCNSTFRCQKLLTTHQRNKCSKAVQAGQAGSAPKQTQTVLDSSDIDNHLVSTISDIEISDIALTEEVLATEIITQICNEESQAVETLNLIESSACVDEENIAHVDELSTFSGFTTTEISDAAEILEDLETIEITINQGDEVVDENLTPLEFESPIEPGCGTMREEISLNSSGSQCPMQTTTLSEGDQESCVSSSESDITDLPDNPLANEPSTSSSCQANVQHTILDHSYMEIQTEVEAGLKSKNIKKQSKFDLKNQKLRESGKEYEVILRNKDGTTKLVKKPCRSLMPPCNPNARCRTSPIYNCSAFSEEERMTIFKSFWDCTWEAKKSLTSSLIEKSEVMRRSARSNFDRQNTFHYYLYHSEREAKLRVCSQMFSNTFSLSLKTFVSWICKTKRKPKTPAVPREKPTRKESTSVRRKILNAFLISLTKDQAQPEGCVADKKWKSLLEIFRYYRSQVEDPLSKPTFLNAIHTLNLTVDNMVKL